MNIAELKEDYSARLPIIEQFAKSVRTQLIELLWTHSITLGVSSATVSGWCREGKIQATKVNGR